MNRKPSVKAPSKTANQIFLQRDEYLNTKRDKQQFCKRWEIWWCSDLVQKGSEAIGAASELWHFGWCWFLAWQFLCMIQMLQRSHWLMSACLHITSSINLSKTNLWAVCFFSEDAHNIPSTGENLMKSKWLKLLLFHQKKNVKLSLKRFNRDCVEKNPCRVMERESGVTVN